MIQAIFRREREVDVVEQIERLHTELNRGMLCKLRILDQGRVRGECPRSPQYVFPRVAKGTRRIYGKRGGIEVFLHHRPGGPSGAEHYRSSVVIGLVLVISAEG